MHGKLINPNVTRYFNKNQIVALPTDFYFDDDHREPICDASIKNHNENFNNTDKQVNRL